MTDERALEAADRGAVSDVPRDEWSSWCAGASSDHGGRELELHRRDRALGDVCLAAGQRLVAIEHDVFGDSEALTIKYGSAEVPVSCVVVAPQAIEQRRDETGDVREVSIIDIVGRRTRCVLM